MNPIELIELLEPIWRGRFEELFRLWCVHAGLLVAAQILVSALVLLLILLGLPLRRTERTLWLLGLLDLALDKGEDVQTYLLKVAQVGNGSHEMEFERLGELLRCGTPWDQALDQCPGFLPRPVVAVLQAGVRIGDLRAAIRICRQRNQDSRAHAQSTFQFLFPTAWITLPVMPVIGWTLVIWVFPKYREIMRYLSAGGLPVGFEMGWVTWVVAVQTLLSLGVMALMLGRLACSVLSRLASLDRSLFFDAIRYAIPWRRRRLRRDFSSVLAMALDRGLPDREAIEVASAAVPNRLLDRQLACLRRSIDQGIALPEALTLLDRRGEWSWWMRNLPYQEGRVADSLRGWVASSTARAAQQELTTAQVAGALLVLMGGVSTGLLAFAVVSPLAAIVDLMTLW